MWHILKAGTLAELLRESCMQRGFGPALPHALCVLSQQPMLAASLRRLLQNDSLLDISSRRSLYLALVQLLKHLGVPHMLTGLRFAC